MESAEKEFARGSHLYKKRSPANSQSRPKGADGKERRSLLGVSYDRKRGSRVQSHEPVLMVGLMDFEVTAGLEQNRDIATQEDLGGGRVFGDELVSFKLECARLKQLMGCSVDPVSRALSPCSSKLPFQQALAKLPTQ